MVDVFPFYHHWSAVVFVVLLACSITYIWLPGYVEFDNIKERVIIKRYQYKLRTPRVIPYADVIAVELNFNQGESNSHRIFLLYFFQLKLNDGSMQPMFGLSNKKKAKKIKTWIDEHVSFDFEMKRNRIKRRKPILNFSSKKQS